MTHTNELPTKSPLHFARFEFKYVLSAALRKEIEKELAFFLHYDPFVESREGHRYSVRSLYYDDPVYSAFYDKVDGLHSRSKYRLRTYTFDSEQKAPLFLEIKGRHNNLVFKHRALILKEKIDWTHLMGDELTSTVLNQVDEGVVKNQFEFDCIRKRLQPLALIDYLRRPYISKFDSDFRITFDEHLRVTQTKNLFPSHDKITTKQILPGYTVLEVKFRHHMPAWFHRIIQAYELKRVSISKICEGMEVLGLAFDLN